MYKGGTKAIYISWFFPPYDPGFYVWVHLDFFSPNENSSIVYLFIYSLLMHDSFFLWCHRRSLKPWHVFLHLSQSFLFLDSPGCTPICRSQSFLLQTNIYITLTVCPSSLRGVCFLSLFGSCSCLPLQNLFFFSASFYIALLHYNCCLKLLHFGKVRVEIWGFDCLPVLSFCFSLFLLLLDSFVSFSRTINGKCGFFAVMFKSSFPGEKTASRVAVAGSVPWHGSLKRREPTTPVARSLYLQLWSLPPTPTLQLVFKLLH